MPTIPHICIKCGQVFYEWAYRNYKRCPECRKPDPPFTKDQLDKLYIGQMKSIRQIAEELGSTRRIVEYWMKKFNIQARAPIKTRFPNRPDPPSKEVLYNLYWIRYLSYDEIANIYHVDKTAIPYWLLKNNIPRRNLWETRRKGINPQEPTSEELKILYCDQGLSTEDIGNLLGISAHTIANRLKKYGIATRFPGYNQIRYIGKDGHNLLSGLEMRVDDWLSEHGIEHIYEPTLPFGGKADFLVDNIYIEVWGISHNSPYEQRTKEKIRLYKKHGLILIGLYPKDVFKNLEKKLKPLTY